MLTTVGAVVSTITPVVFGGEKPRFESLPAASRMVPPFSCRVLVTAMPSASVSPGCTVYWKVRAFVPLPLR